MTWHDTARHDMIHHITSSQIRSHHRRVEWTMDSGPWPMSPQAVCELAAVQSDFWVVAGAGESGLLPATFLVFAWGGSGSSMNPIISSLNWWYISWVASGWGFFGCHTSYQVRSSFLLHTALFCRDWETCPFLRSLRGDSGAAQKETQASSIFPFFSPQIIRAPWLIQVDTLTWSDVD